jgi:transposase-like protein
MDLSWLDDLQPFDKRELSPQAQKGLGAARSLQPLRGNEAGPAIRELADYHQCDPSTVRRWISKARRELERDPGHCHECDTPLPRGCRNSRRYCEQHANPTARGNRHRRRSAGAKC